MPWDAESIKKHNKSLSLTEARIAAKIANDVLKETGDEARALKAANVRIKIMRGKHG